MFKPSHSWFYPSSSLSPQFLRIPIVTEFSHVTNQFLPIISYHHLFVIWGFPYMGYPHMDGLFHGKSHRFVDDWGVPL